MYIGDLLIAHGLVTPADVGAALTLQQTQGGKLGGLLVQLGKLNAVDLDAVVQAAPQVPSSIADTGLAPGDLLNLALKAMYAGGVETPSAIAEILKLPNGIVQQIIADAQEKRLIDVLSAAGLRITAERRFALTERGKSWAAGAFELNQYVGPAPVSLAAFCDRIQQQAIGKERVDRAAIDRAFAGLSVEPRFIEQVGPAINSGRSILLYGPPGNGKTTVAERMGGMFREVAYIPYAFEVEGQIIKVFDPGVHHAYRQGPIRGATATALRREDFDARWVPCRRPFIVAGGELTLEMLDLSFNPLAKFYEAPLHVKALGGIFTIDDFGRQLVSPEALLNRWIVPLERRVDYLKLHTGKSFSLPFDELVIFSTNLSPQDLMDPAFLRRIPYKLPVGAPTVAQYREIFHALAKTAGVGINDQWIDYIIGIMRDRGGMALASYQPKFIIDQVVAACKFAGVPVQLRPELVTLALGNLAIAEHGSGAPASISLAHERAA